MRISTVTMFEQSTASMNRQQSDFLKISQQIASGRRVVNPSDDPLAASRAVRVGQSIAITEQYAEARISARSSVAQTESIMNSIADATASAKTLLIQASSDTLSDVDRESIASELKGIYETLIGQANATDGNGRYLFGGYRDNAPPFTKDAGGNVAYRGDNNAREQQVDASRRMPVTHNGAAIFQGVPSSAGYLAVAEGDNEGSVTFSGPYITDVSADGYGEDYRITFGGDADNPTYSVVRVSDGNDIVTDAAYEAGQQISFGGINITLNGAPEAGDEILVAQAGSDAHSADLFRTLESAIAVLDKPAQTDAEKAALRNTLNTSMRELDNALDNVLTLRAEAGARENELDVIDSVAGNRMLNYQQTQSDLVDLDYNAAISDYVMRQIGLQASQQSFVNIKGMSLLNYM